MEARSVNGELIQIHETDSLNHDCFHACGQKVWSSAHVLLDYLEGSHNVRGKDVLELGAGTGVVGITLAAHGANVTLTDRRLDVKRESISASGDIELLTLTPEDEERVSTHILRLLQHNVAGNASAIQGRIDIAELQWANQSHIDRLLRSRRYYDIIVGSDLIYDGQFITPLLETVRQVATLHTRTYLADPGRRGRTVSNFQSMASKHFHVDQVHQSQDGTKVYELRRRQSDDSRV